MRGTRGNGYANKQTGLVESCGMTFDCKIHFEVVVPAVQSINNTMFLLAFINQMLMSKPAQSWKDDTEPWNDEPGFPIAYQQPVRKRREHLQTGQPMNLRFLDKAAPSVASKLPTSSSRRVWVVTTLFQHEIVLSTVSTN